MSTKPISVDAIDIGTRHRKTLGDLGPTKASIERVGLLHAIVVRNGTENGRYVLIAGERRLAIVKELGWSVIPARVVDLDEVSSLIAEQDENGCRLDFTPSEKVAIAKAIEEREREKAKERQRQSGGDHGNQYTGGKSGGSEKVAQPPKPRATDKAAASVGMSRPTYEKAKEVVEAAEKDPALAPVVEEMDATGNVSAAHRKVQEAQAEPAPEVARDAVGFPIPPKCLPAFEAADEIGRACRELDQVKAKLKGLTVGYRLLPINWVQELEKLRKAIWAGRATHVCPYCQGNDAACKPCKGEGWASDTIYNGLPAKHREAMQRVIDQDKAKAG